VLTLKKEIVMLSVRMLVTVLVGQFMFSTAFAAGFEISADSFVKNESTNVKVNPGYRNLITSDSGAGLSKLTYRFYAPSGNYQVLMTYAAAESRPVVVEANGVLVSSNGLSAVTGGWIKLNTATVGDVRLREGDNVLVIRRNAVIPHIGAISFRQK